MIIEVAIAAVLQRQNKKSAMELRRFLWNKRGFAMDIIFHIEKENIMNAILIIG
jgi:hypothetical protein